MNPFLSHLHDELRNARFTRRGSTMQDPKDVPVGLHKEYPRMERIALPNPTPLPMPIDEVLRRRQSAFEWKSNVLSLEACGTLFGHALGKRADSSRRHYPSGGGLYPIETYLFTEKLEGAKSGVFHFNPSAHALERLWDFPAGFDIKTLAPIPPEFLFTSIIVLTSVWERSSAKYGDLAFLHALLEAGHMSENVCLVAAAMGLPIRPFAGFTDTLITELLDLDPTEEQPVHSLLIGAT